MTTEIKPGTIEDTRENNERIDALEARDPPALEEIETALNSGQDPGVAILPNGEVVLSVDDTNQHLHNDLELSRLEIKKMQAKVGGVSNEIKCDFCGKTRREVAKLIASETGTAICDECIVVSFAKMAGSKIRFMGPAPRRQKESKQ